MSKKSALALTVLISMSLVGCKSLAKPSLYHPGSAAVQQNRAVRFDPFPQDETGQGVSAVRPREYDKPVAEPARARWQDGNLTQ